MKNILSKTKVYLIGAMQYDQTGRKWRDDISDTLRDMNVTIFDPYKKPFINAPDETEDTHNKLCHLMETGKRKAELDFSGFDMVADSITIWTWGGNSKMDCSHTEPRCSSDI